MICGESVRTSLDFRGSARIAAAARRGMGPKRAEGGIDAMRTREMRTASDPTCPPAPHAVRGALSALLCAVATLGALACLALAGCDGPRDSTPPRYAAPMRSEAELGAALQRLCEQAGGDRPLLVEFSAAWCSDCQRLQEMKRAEALATELAQWPHTTVNVGRFDRHRAILDAMAIESIAHWSVLTPESCDDPIERWTRIADRTLEVSSGEARSLTPADLARWLRRLRTS